MAQNVTINIGQQGAQYVATYEGIDGGDGDEDETVPTGLGPSPGEAVQDLVRRTDLDEARRRIG